MQSLLEFMDTSRGRRAKRTLSFWVAVLLVTAASALALVSDYPVFAQSSVNNFKISDYQIDYELGLNESKRSTLATTETITAYFPNRNQNRGILREVPHTYDGHKVNLKIDSVKDKDGNSVEYDTEKSGSMTTIRIGDPDEYVFGEQVYVIKYTQQDVTKFFESSTGRDEFYWDTNGTGWRVPIEKLSVSLKLMDGLEKRLVGENACYEGIKGSSDRCELIQKDNVFDVEANNLGTSENVTVAIGFEAGTFAEYEPSAWDKFLALVQKTWITVGIIGAIVATFLSFRWSNLHNRKKEVGTIVNQFLSPKDMSVSAAAKLYNKPLTQYTAQLLDLAVRGYIQIIETKPKKSWMSPAEHDIEIKKDISNLKDEEREIIQDLFFEKGTTVGNKVSLKKVSKKTGYSAKRLDDSTNLQILFDKKYHFREKNSNLSKGFYITAGILFAVAVFSLNIFASIAATFIFTLGATLKPFTDKGLEAVRYLKGLERYMKVAEKDRINYLNSPEGIQKVPTGVDVDNPEQVLKLNEKLLPYAVLFGMEKKWLEELAVNYQSANSQPSWYSGSSSYTSSAALVGALQGFNSSASYANSSSSPSGGSSGGGSSGGGGGGGGGGGW